MKRVECTPRSQAILVLWVCITVAPIVIFYLSNQKGHREVNEREEKREGSHKTFQLSTGSITPKSLAEASRSAEEKDSPALRGRGHWVVVSLKKAQQSTESELEPLVCTKPSAPHRSYLGTSGHSEVADAKFPNS